jgi:putative SOS response-associated peptidase YedK
MPVILDPANYGTWLDPDLHDPERLKSLLRPCLSEWITYYPVSRRVGNPVNDDPECVSLWNQADGSLSLPIPSRKRKAVP